MCARAITCALLLMGELFAASIVSAASSGSDPGSDPGIGPGRGSFLFDQWAGPALRVFYFVPPEVRPQTPVIFVSHGVKRNAASYRDQWVSLAREHRFVLAVPEFPQADFPRMPGYNLGYVFGKDGSQRPREKWAFSAIEPIFDFLREHLALHTEAYAMYGHSAGAQFVCRYLYYVPEARISRAVAANAGWYTMPDVSIEYPFGLIGSGLNRSMLDRALARPLLLLLGEKDSDPRHRSLNKTPGAMAQGAHRLARGKAFYKAGQAQARHSGVALGWSLRTVPGVGHSNKGMAPAAISHLLAAEENS